MFRTQYDKLSVSCDCGGKSKAHPEFKEECDLNWIMRRTSPSQLAQHNAKYAGSYGNFVGPSEYNKALIAVQDAEQLFFDLPSDIRSKFKNSPHEYLEFVGTASDEELADIGIKADGRVKRDPSPVSVSSDAPSDDKSESASSAEG